MSLIPYLYQPLHDAFLAMVELFGLSEESWDVGTPGSGSEQSLQSQGDAPADSGLLRPKMDLHESDSTNETTATFELPGMQKDDVTIAVQPMRLVVSGTSTPTDTLDEGGYVVRERRFGAFSRSILPEGTKPEDVTVSMENGVLAVRFPKSHPDQEPMSVTTP